MSDGDEKKRLADQIWLGYFNRVLLEKGVITEREHNRMSLLIERRGSARSSGYGS